jgi:hypothetical protein
MGCARLVGRWAGPGQRRTLGRIKAWVGSVGRPSLGCPLLVELVEFPGVGIGPARGAIVDSGAFFAAPNRSYGTGPARGGGSEGSSKSRSAVLAWEFAFPLAHIRSN